MMSMVMLLGIGGALVVVVVIGIVLAFSNR